MPSAPCKFKETEMKRAIRSALGAGLQISSVEITKAGSIVVHAGKPTDEPVTHNPWDEKR